MSDLTQDAVDKWIQLTATGQFHYKQILEGLVSPKLHPTLRVYVRRAVDKGIAVNVNGKDGWYRPVEKESEEIRWWEGIAEGSALKLPLDLHEYANIYRPALIVVAGQWNQGKTAFILNTLKLNLTTFKDNIHLFVSEAPEMLKNRFIQLGIIGEEEPEWKTWKRTRNFQDAIVSDALNLVDYLRVDMEKPYAVSGELLKIYEALGKKGIAVVAMQKPSGNRGMAFGGESTAFEPALYIAIGKGKMWFEKIKSPTLKGDFDPYNITFSFRISRGVNFYDVSWETGRLDT